MVDQVETRPRAATWRPGFPAGRGPLLSWPRGTVDLARTVADRLWSWALAEVAPGRLVPWLAITFGLGTVLYFTAYQEPSPWAAAGALIAASCVAASARRHVILFPLCVAVAAVTAGFAAGTIKRAIIAHPVLQVATSNVSIEGCQSAPNRDPGSASKRDPTFLRFERLALAPSELVGVAETARARVGG